MAKEKRFDVFVWDTKTRKFKKVASNLTAMQASNRREQLRGRNVEIRRAR